MHEWALAEAVVEAVRAQTGDRGDVAVRRVSVEFGELQSIDRDVFATGLQEITRGTPLAGAEFELNVRKARLRCNACGREWDFADAPLSEEERESIHFLPEVVHAFMACPECGSPDFEPIEGRGVTIESIEFAGAPA